MNKIEIIEVGCSLVNDSYLPFYEKPEDKADFNLNLMIEFLSELDLSKMGKIDIVGNTKSLVINLLGTDDFGPPPRNLRVIFNLNGKKHQIRIPFNNSNIIYFDLVED